MITIERMMTLKKSDLQEASKKLDEDDIRQLVELLPVKDDSIRYQAFLLLQNRSNFNNEVYPYWGNFRDKLKSDNSYQRSIGLMLIAENVKWDIECRIEDTIDEFLEILNDEKTITIRQCIQSLGKIVPNKPGLNEKIASKLIMFDIMAVKETMRRPILLDIINTLLIIGNITKKDEIDSYILNALSGGILDKKAKTQIKALL